MASTPVVTQVIEHRKRHEERRPKGATLLDSDPLAEARVYRAVMYLDPLKAAAWPASEWYARILQRPLYGSDSKSE